MVQDQRILELDRIVAEVKENEEWEAVQMNLIEIGMEAGMEAGKAVGIAEAVIESLEDYGVVPQNVQDAIFAEKDLKVLKKWNKLAAKAESIEEFLVQM